MRVANGNVNMSNANITNRSMSHTEDLSISLEDWIKRPRKEEDM